VGKLRPSSEYHVDVCAVDDKGQMVGVGKGKIRTSQVGGVRVGGGAMRRRNMREQGVAPRGGDNGGVANNRVVLSLPP